MAHAGWDWGKIRSKLTAARLLAMAEELPPDVAAAPAADPTCPQLFAAAFGDGAITVERMALAIATYERILVRDQAPLDLFLAGDSDAMTARQQDGFNLFPGSACAMCHPFPQFTDNAFRNVGVRPSAEDPGRQVVTGNPDDAGKFKIPLDVIECLNAGNAGY